MSFQLFPQPPDSAVRGRDLKFPPPLPRKPIRGGHYGCEPYVRRLHPYEQRIEEDDQSCWQKVFCAV